MILVRVVLANMMVQVPLVLQIEMLETIVVMMVMMRRILMRILKNSQIGLKPKRRV